MTGGLPESGRGIIQPTLSNDMRETPASVGVFLCPAVLAATEPRNPVQGRQLQYDGKNLNCPYVGTIQRYQQHI